MTKLLKWGVCAAAICATAFTASSAMARRGADDPAGHVRQCRGCDDAPGDVRQGRGADDPADHDANDDRGGDRPGGRGRGADDAADHDANDDRGGDRVRTADDSAQRQSRGADDSVADNRGRGRGRGRGGDDAPGDDRGGQGRGSDDPS